MEYSHYTQSETIQWYFQQLDGSNIANIVHTPILKIEKLYDVNPSRNLGSQSQELLL